MTMMVLKAICLALLLVVAIERGESKVFWETVDLATERLQKVPPTEETVKKMSLHLFQRTSSRLRVTRALNKPEDVLLVIDSSKSVPVANFTQGLQALKSLVTRFPPSTNFAAILFSTRAKVMFKFVSPHEAMGNLVNIRYDGGLTNTQAALRKSGKLFSRKDTGVRNYAYKRMFILTDGQSNVKKKNTLYLAYMLKEMGVEVFVMAVGQRIDGINELAMLATSTDKHLYRVGEMNQFVEVVQKISSDPYYNKHHA